MREDLSGLSSRFTSQSDANLDVAVQAVEGKVRRRHEKVAAVHFKRVVFDSTAVNAVLYASSDSDFSFVLSCLIADTRRLSNELSKIAAIKS